ncbi:MAG TPA: multicopper oxidase domain-containing protein, partial [Acidimicrobiia bacterium]
MTDSSKVFDRVTLLVAISGLLVMASILVLVVRGPSAAGAAADGTVAEIQLTEFSISGDLAVPEGPVDLAVTNAGNIVHNLTLVDGPRTPDLDAGESARLSLGEMEAGQYQLICAIPGHESSGMTATLTVGDPVAPDVHAGHSAGEYAAMDMAMTQSILAFPASSEGRGNQLLEPNLLADGTKQFEITISISPWEVEAGRSVEAWTYNGQVPGPAIRVDDGDRVEVIFHNELPMGTDVHFHGVRLENQMDGVAPLTQPLIEPGDSFTYSFVAVGPAVSMYHAHHHGQLQVPNGLFGTIIIGDTPLPLGRVIGGIEVPEDLEVVTEIPMVLNDAGVIGYSLNGKSFPATEPLVVGVDDWFVVHYYNEGLQIHPMHLHGFPQLVFSKDGYPLDEPYWVDTLNVAPGERYSILVHADAAGAWVWHCHILNHVEREEGMFGMVTA